MQEHPYQINEIAPIEYPEVVMLWEASVRATHHFLKEGDIAFYKPLVLQYLPQLRLGAIRNEEGRLAGFFAASEDTIEMLFVHPEEFGKGIGKAILNYLTKELQVLKVDVNEDNTQAVKFYERYGFRTNSRSEMDASDKPYPLLHMSL